MIFPATERRQLRALIRLFASRLFDTDAVQVQSDVFSTMAHAAALGAAMSLVVCLMVIHVYVIGNPPATARWAHEESLISTAMAVVGVLALMVWDSLFPDRLDSTILGALPLRRRTVLVAKIAAIAIALSIAIIAANSFTGLVFPIFILPAASDPVTILRCFAAYWIVISLASLFAFLVILSLQGIAIQVFPHASFLRWSGLIQGAAFFAALTIYFLAPHLATPAALASPANSIWFAVLPSYWFLGLFQVLNGSSDAIFVDLAKRAVVAVGIAILFAATCLVPAFARQMRRTVEQSGITPRRRGSLNWIARLICPDQEERAMFAFISRTLARSRRHRSQIAIYAGLGAAYVFSGAARLLYEPDSFVSSTVRNWEIAGIPLSILFFVIIGIRVSFSIPVEIRANWIFRMTDPFGSGIYLSAARKTLLAIAVAPVVVISAMVYGAIWPIWTMLAHITFITAVGVLLVELALTGWDKVPFACTHLPGKGNLKVMFGVYFVLLWFLSQMVAAAECEALKTPAGYALLMLATLAGWWYAARRAQSLKAGLKGVRFEDEREDELTTLGISTAPPRHRLAYTRVAEPTQLFTFGAPNLPETREQLTLQGWNYDVRYALRMWRKNPAFTIVAISLLAIGIAANTAVFTVANGILFKKLPFKNSQRILYLRSTPRTPLFSYADFLDLRNQIQSFNSLAAYEYASANLSDRNGPPERYRTMRMSSNALSVMEQHPIIGRDFLPEDELPGAIPVAMLTYDLWTNRYAQDRSILGKSIQLSGVTTVIVGITPPGVRFGGNNDLWTPLTRPRQSEKRDNRHLMIFGMLTKTATRTSATTEVETITRGLSNAYLSTNKGLSATVQTLTESHLPKRVTVLFSALIGAVGFVLLIVCANIANMLLARAMGRNREMAIRAALGASRSRMIRQLLTESLLLAVAGGALGCLLATWATTRFVAGLSRLGASTDFNIDAKVLLFLLAISIGSAILFGLAPALRASGTLLEKGLKDGSAGIGLRHLRLSSLLISAEIALAVVLLAGAGVMIRSIVNISHTPIGVNAQNVLTMRLDLPSSRTTNEQTSFYARLKTNLESLPGVESVSMTTDLPGNGWIRDTNQLAYEVDTASIENETRTAAMVIGPGYFHVMQVRPTSGREFNDSDGTTEYQTVVVNQSLANQAWPHQNPVGKRLRITDSATPNTWRHVIGVVPDILQNDFGQGEPRVYIPYRQQPQLSMCLIARTQVPPDTLGAAFRIAVRNLDPSLAVYEMRSLNEHIELHHLDMNMFTTVFGAFAGIGLLLAAIGLYAVVSHSVSQRIHEIGVRKALGASSLQICGLVFGRAIQQLAAGLALGLLLALSATKILSSLLVGTEANDPLTFLTAIAILSAAGLLGCAIPARHALNVDPMSALRAE